MLQKHREGRKMTLKNGVTVELFPISELAEYLGRTTQTVRKWELSGVLPNSLFRDKRGYRLYTREQIMLIGKVAEESKLMTGRQYSKIKFSKLVKEGLAKLNLKYTT